MDEKLQTAARYLHIVEGVLPKKDVCVFGVPTIVIVNRRVPSADIEASKNTVHDSSIDLASAKDMPRSFGLRAELSLVFPPDDPDNTIDSSNEDDDTDFGDV